MQVTQLSRETGLQREVILRSIFDQIPAPAGKVNLSSVSFSAGEQNYLLVCDNHGTVEGLPKIPPAVREYASELGQIPAYDKDTGLYVYFDNHLRMPVPDLTCSEIKKAAKKTKTPVFNLKASPVPKDVLEFVNKHFSVAAKNGNGKSLKLNFNPVKGMVSPTGGFPSTPNTNSGSKP